ncbi:hypothetical protein NDU88_005562 [Pleurodeles waltl]|uniref:TGF-beta family profile domain-containing protein n=1 Tax=Pleurodeles waltl TaxID=8319 RepID=A0AAV7LCS6_PLEWA|nr:hypothetical protein NDU88_005562 [Pleurodeles waltl]
MRSSGQSARYPEACLALLFLLTAVELRPLGEQEKRIQLEAVKRGILERLGLHRPPPTHQRLDKEALQRMYKVYEETLLELKGNTSQEENMLTATENRVHLLTPKLTLKIKTTDSRQGQEKHSHAVNLVFSRTLALHQELRVLKAELQLQKHFLIAQSQRFPIINYRPPPMVNIYKVTESSDANGEPELKLLDSKPFETGTLNLNVVKAVQEWVASPEERLQMKLMFISDFPLVSEVNQYKKWTDSLILEVETQKASKARARKTRELPTQDQEDCKKNEKHCCRKSLHVSFKEIGLSDWVIAPESYTMFFCEGSCPRNYKSASMHAQIKSKMHQLSNGATPGPCCVPASYEPLLLMHYNSAGELSLTPCEDILVRKCHCA